MDRFVSPAPLFFKLVFQLQIEGGGWGSYIFVCENSLHGTLCAIAIQSTSSSLSDDCDSSTDFSLKKTKQEMEATRKWRKKWVITCSVEWKGKKFISELLLLVYPKVVGPKLMNFLSSLLVSCYILASSNYQTHEAQRHLLLLTLQFVQISEPKRKEKKERRAAFGQIRFVQSHARARLFIIYRILDFGRRAV